MRKEINKRENKIELYEIRGWLTVKDEIKRLRKTIRHSLNDEAEWIYTNDTNKKKLRQKKKKKKNIDEKATKERNTNFKWIAVQSQVSLSKISLIAINHYIASHLHYPASDLM